MADVKLESVVQSLMRTRGVPRVTAEVVAELADAKQIKAASEAMAKLERSQAMACEAGETLKNIAIAVQVEYLESKKATVDNQQEPNEAT